MNPLYVLYNKLSMYVWVDMLTISSICNGDIKYKLASIVNMNLMNSKLQWVEKYFNMFSKWEKCINNYTNTSS